MAQLLRGDGRGDLHDAVLRIGGGLGQHGDDMIAMASAQRGRQEVGQNRPAGARGKLGRRVGELVPVRLAQLVPAEARQEGVVA